MVYRWYKVSSNGKNTVVILIVCSNLTLQNLCSISECIYRKCLGCHFFSSSKWTSRYGVTSWLWDKYTVNGKQCQGQCQGCFRSVVVITCASHAQGPQFDPGQRQVLFIYLFLSSCSLHLFCYNYFAEIIFTSLVRSAAFMSFPNRSVHSSHSRPDRLQRKLPMDPSIKSSLKV